VPHEERVGDNMKYITDSLIYVSTTIIVVLTYISESVINFSVGRVAQSV